jgi:hypothetical protein
VTLNGVSYGMHDLLREYAREPGTESEDRQAALSLLFDYYRADAAAATDVLYPARRRWLAGGSGPRSSGSWTFTPATARAWLDAELANLIATIAHGAAHGRPGHAIDLAATLVRARVTPAIGPPTRGSAWQRMLASLRGWSTIERAIAVASIAALRGTLTAVSIGSSSKPAHVAAAGSHAKANAQRIITPLYADPASGEWSSLARTAPTTRAAIVDICAPDGSGSGCNGKPADAAAPGWSAMVAAMRRACVVPLYYISTNYAVTPLSTAETEVKDAITWYKTASIFFD